MSDQPDPTPEQPDPTPDQRRDNLDGKPTSELALRAVLAAAVAVANATFAITLDGGFTTFLFGTVAAAFAVAAIVVIVEIAKPESAEEQNP